MRLVTKLSLLSILTPMSAHSATPPGPPPYSCFAHAVCDETRTCSRIGGIPTEFFAFEVNGFWGRSFVFEGMRGRKTKALYFADLETAQETIGNIDKAIPFGAVAISRSDVADAHGFSIHSVMNRSGENQIAKSSTMIICNSVVGY